MDELSTNVMRSGYYIGKSIDITSRNPELTKLPPRKFFSDTELSLIHEMVKLCESGNKDKISDADYIEKLKADKKISDQNNIYYARSYNAKEFMRNGINNMGVTQAVDIGCGFNFAIADLAFSNPNVQFFAVDKKEVMDMYKKVLYLKFPNDIKNLTLVPCDLEKDNFAATIKNAPGYDISKRTVFNMQGVASHLKEETFMNIVNFVGTESVAKSLFSVSLLNNPLSAHETVLSSWTAKNVFLKKGITPGSSMTYNSMLKRTCNKLGIEGVEPNDDIGGVCYECICKGKEKNVKIADVVSMLKQFHSETYTGRQ